MLHCGRFKCFSQAQRSGYILRKGRKAVIGSAVLVDNQTPSTQSNGIVDYVNSKLSNKKYGNNLLIAGRGKNQRLVFKTTQNLKAGEVVLRIPEDEAITSIDAGKHDTIGKVAEECSELVAIALWLMSERAKGSSSTFNSFLSSLPIVTETPILWSITDLEELLKGSPVVSESKERAAALKKTWQQLQDQYFQSDVARYPPEVYNEVAFSQAFSVVCGHASFLPSAGVFALLPVASLLGRTGNGNGAELDYNSGSGEAVVITTRPYKAGEELLLNDPRPNGELLLATGTLPEGENAADFLLFKASLLNADRMFSVKQEVLQQMGMDALMEFPVYKNKMPIQLLSYCRLSRVADSAMLAKVSFQEDVILSQMNEYEVLQLLMGDCRERLAAYRASLEEDVKALQASNLSTRQRLALQLTVSEKRILSSTMDALRRRLAPIRGIPTKAGGMQDPNSDLREIFETIEALPSIPSKLFGGLVSWARGDDDPDWKKKK